MVLSPLVLAVDDDTATLRLLRLQLSGEGFDVVTAESGEEALGVAEQRRPDVVLLDVRMPGMGGLEVLRRLKERLRVAVILITAQPCEADRRQGLRLGADAYLQKPVPAGELGARIRALAGSG